MSSSVWRPARAITLFLGLIVALALLDPRQAAAQSSGAAVQLTPLNAQFLKFKLQSREPDYQRLTAEIVNGAERDKKIAEMKQMFAALDIHAKFHSDFYETSFQSNTISHQLFTSWGNQTVMPIGALGRLGSFGIWFSNWQDVHAIDLTKAPSNPVIDKALHNNEMFQGTAVFDFRIHKEKPDLVGIVDLPIVMKPAGLVDANKINAFATRMELYDAQRRLFYAADFTEPQEAAASQTTYSDTLAKTGKPEDFDVRGLRVSMTIPQIRDYASSQHFIAVDGARDASDTQNNIKSLILHDGHCTLENGAPGYFMGQSTVYPSAIGGWCIIVRYRDQTPINIKYVFVTNESAEDLGKAILEKYGMPLMTGYTPSIYLWGEETPANADKMIYPRAFEVAFDKGGMSVPSTAFTVTATVYNPNMPSEAVVKPKL